MTSHLTQHFNDTDVLLDDIDSGLEFKAIPQQKNIFFAHGELQVPKSSEKPKINLLSDMQSLMLG